MKDVEKKGEVLWRHRGMFAILEVLASGLCTAQFKAHTSGNIIPIGAEVRGPTRRQSASPSQWSQLAWEFNGGAGCRRFFGCGGCGVGEGEEESRDAGGLRGVRDCLRTGAESQEDVGDGNGMIKEGGGGRGGKERWK